MCYLAIRVILMSSNENRGKGHVGEGQGHMGRSERVCWYCSGACRCTGRGVGEGGAFGGKVGCELKIFSGKLKSRWSGPFTISEIYPYGTAKLIHPDGCNFKVNCHRLKHYHGRDPPPLEIPDIHTFPKDN
uniref:Reverse transcriptase domain-containing protein n=1 Tax=Tanacetum cinerariifolium TaxID=118510 RepID=A0A699HSD9_TANCI|nr:reverse transcriptase domain-containing protein [Tanacetum cinerariifolium]